MNAQQQPRVAVLFATYNGARYVEEQIKSLAENATPFTLHWLDDHSTDNTRDAVRKAAFGAGIMLQEWHQPQRHGVPGTFYELIERVDADIYLFCDQDDIWQRGKIDATVADILPDLASPVISFSDPLVFYEDQPEVFFPLSDIRHIKAPAALERSRALMSTPVAGQSMAITRPLRDMYLGHRDIARSHAYMHSWWLYLLAVTAGEARMLSDVPRTLYRQHGSNVTTPYFARHRTIISHIISKWREQKLLRPGMSQQARGFILASTTLPPGPKVDQMLALARLVATIEQRQSPFALARLLFRRATWPSWHQTFWLIVACLWSDAKQPTMTTPAAKGGQSSASLSTA